MKRRNGYRIGEGHQRAKLSDAQVDRMRRLYRPGVVGYKSLASLFGCGESTARDICTYRTRT